MPEDKASLLIVDDEPSIRSLLSQILTENGYSVRSAADGLSALDEIRREAPEILLSDLDMPGMSGLELLPVVRRRFPRIHLVAMSGAFSSNGVPSGIIADAFYEKGGGLGTLLRIMESLPRPERMAQQPHAAPPPVWVSRCLRNSDGEGYVIIECPECARNFPKVLDRAVNGTSETNCFHCGSPVRYAIVQSDNRDLFRTFLLPPQCRHSAPSPALQSTQRLAS
jgi:CheY-like chemotaxis protein